MDSLFNDTTLYDSEEHIKKDVPAYHIDEHSYDNEIIEPKQEIKTNLYDEMTDDEIDRQYQEILRQREERKKKRKEKDFEM